MLHFTDKCCPPFRTHPQHGRVFAPWGIFGTQYFITDEAAYNKLRKVFPLTPWFTYLWLFYAPHLLGSNFHLTAAWQCVIGVGLALLSLILYCRVVKRAVVNLTIAEPRPPFFLALRLFSQQLPLKALWMGNIVSLFGASLFAYIAHLCSQTPLDVLVLISALVGIGPAF